MDTKQGHFMLSKHLDATIESTLENGSFLVLRKQGLSNELKISSTEWDHLHKQHEKINTTVLEQWRKPKIEGGEEDVFVWKGWESTNTGLFKTITVSSSVQVEPFVEMAGDTIMEQLEMTVHEKHLLATMMELAGLDSRAKFQVLMDLKMKSVRLGEDTRIRVRFTNEDTQVHFYKYDPRTTAVITLLQLSFSEWVELYKHFTEIDGLMHQQRAKGRRRGGVDPAIY